VIGRPVTHNDIDAEAWIGGAIAAGFVPGDYAVMLRWLTGAIISATVPGRMTTSRRSRAGRRSPSLTSPGGMHPPGPSRRPSDHAHRRRRLRGAGPLLRIIEEGLADFVDGGHFFDLLAEDVIFEYVISVPGYPRRVEGRRAVAELYRGYGSTMVLRSADELAVHRDREASVIVLEYAVHGQAVQPGGPTTTASSR